MHETTYTTARETVTLRPKLVLAAIAVILRLTGRSDEQKE